jgi:beta-ureidopropionase / N-carbamoyl-L-amino-acid hydrolase
MDGMWADLLPVGRDDTTGGYRRHAWTPADLTSREWFAAEAARRGLDLVVDRNGNQWAWWGDPDAGEAGVVTGSHLDSVPDGGAYDGPLGVVSAFAAVDRLRELGQVPRKPLGVANFTDEEGARFGIACAGSRLLTGALDPDRARALVDAGGSTLAEAMRSAGLDPGGLGRDDETLRRVGTFVELHVEQGRGLVDLGAAVGVASGIWPHGRWRFDFDGEANHAGTTRLADRHDPMLGYAAAVLAARTAAEQQGALATFGKIRVEPNGVNAIPSRVTGWLDARAPSGPVVRELVQQLHSVGATVTEESWTDPTVFDTGLQAHLAALLADRDGTVAPVLATGAGHDAGILSLAGVQTAMLFVRNPTGVSHSPEEYAEERDCVAGVEALARVIRDLAS